MKKKKKYGIVVLSGIFLSGIFFMFLFSGPNYDTLAQNAPPTTIHFEQDTIQLGTVHYGEKRNVTFYFTNTGDVPLLLRDVRPSCGCTGTQWKKRPIAPGQRGEINITFAPNSLGYFIKNIDILCNIKMGVTNLKLCGKVIE